MFGHWVNEPTSFYRSSIRVLTNIGVKLKKIFSRYAIVRVIEFIFCIKYIETIIAL